MKMKVNPGSRKGRKAFRKERKGMVVPRIQIVQTAMAGTWQLQAKHARATGSNKNFAAFATSLAAFARNFQG
jgi:hypothetical protein